MRLEITLESEPNHDLLVEELQAQCTDARPAWGTNGILYVEGEDAIEENRAAIEVIVAAHNSANKTAGQIERERNATVKAGACDEMVEGAGAIATITLAEATAFIDDQFDIEAITDLDGVKAALTTYETLFKKIAKAIIALRNENWPELQEHE